MIKLCMICGNAIFYKDEECANCGFEFNKDTSSENNLFQDIRETEYDGDGI